eukprot:TRINITY_DN10645_c0_g1_i9.p1 TRINITY_DN10645_c0_g1~~TRINITY_DN10645_c0_g1_i9.p1  ORF type:complete len:475 (-),score=113.62 TRINITY_DN10645_c0_g1_i9:119-1543(-)
MGMNKLLILLVLFVTAFGRSGIKTTMNAALQSRVLTDLKDALIPIISNKVEYIEVADMKGEARGYSYTLENIHIEAQPVDPANIGIELSKDGIIKVDGTASPMKGNARGKINIGFIVKNFGVDIDIRDLFFAMELRLKSVNNTLAIEVIGLHVDLDKKHVQVKIFGRLPLGLIDALSLKLQRSMTYSIETSIKNILPSKITKATNQALNELTGDIRITDQIFMKYEFPDTPDEADLRLITKMVACLHPFNNQSCPPGDINPVPILSRGNSKGIQLFVSDFVVKSAIYTLFKLNLMNFSIRKVICDHETSLVCAVSELPTFRFARNVIEANITGACNISLDNSTESDIQLSALFQLKLSETVKESALFFNAENFTFSKLTFNRIAPVDTAWLKKALNQTFAAVIEKMNTELGKKGIPLPVHEYVKYEDFLLDTGNGHTMIAANPVFNFTKMGEAKIEQPVQKSVVKEESKKSNKD